MRMTLNRWKWGIARLLFAFAFACVSMMVTWVLALTGREALYIESSMPVSDEAAWTAARSENCAMRAADLAYAVDPRFWSRERSRKVYEECMGK